MRRSFRGHNKSQAVAKEFRVNERIFSPELMIIDENGENLGVMSKAQALSEARSRDLDLIEVSPKAQPPIAKFMDYGSYKYQKEKQERKQKAKTKTVEIKTVKLSLRIGEHDAETRVHQAVNFILDGDKVKIELQLRGRENQHADLARETIQKISGQIAEDLREQKKELKVEQQIIKQGNRLSTVIYS